MKTIISSSAPQRVKPAQNQEYGLIKNTKKIIQGKVQKAIHSKPNDAYFKKQSAQKSVAHFSAKNNARPELS